MVQADAAKELVGALGLPGALMAIAIAFFYGIKAAQALKNGKNGRTGTHEIAGLSYKDAIAISTNAVSLADKSKDAIMSNIDKTRHDVNGNLMTVQVNLSEAVDNQTERLGQKLDKIAELLLRKGSRG